MLYEEFLESVCDHAKLDEVAALAAARATLETLRERITDEEAAHLAAQLPDDLAVYLEGEATGAQGFGIEEFVRRIAQREDVGFDVARRHAEAVLATVREAVTPGELEDVLTQLPRDYEPLFRFQG